MKKLILVSLLLLVIASGVFAMDADIANLPSCSYCGMDRGKFAFSRMLIEYDDDTYAGVCSLHCAAIELAANTGKTPRRILVADHDSTKLIDAESAFWVIGGIRPGVMTANPKWAFASHSSAERFIKANGGVAANFETVIKAAYEDMYQDTKRIRERRKHKKVSYQQWQK